MDGDDAAMHAPFSSSDNVLTCSCVMAPRCASMIVIRQALTGVRSSGAAWFAVPSLHVDLHAMDQAIPAR